MLIDCHVHCGLGQFRGLRPSDLDDLALEAMKDLGVMRLAARISDLKDEGYEIHTEREKSRNRYGEETTYARYSLGGKK